MSYATILAGFASFFYADSCRRFDFSLIRSPFRDHFYPVVLLLGEPKQSDPIGPIRIPIARLQSGFLPIRIPIAIRFFPNNVSRQHVRPMFLITLCFVSILIGGDQARSSPIAEIVQWPKFPD